MANYKVLATWDISIQNLYKDITLIQQGISCKLNISLRSISRVVVNYKVGNEYVTDLCTIDLDNNKVIVPFKKNVLEVGTHALELVCHMKNGDVLPTPNYSYTVTKSLDNTNDITEEDAYPVLIGMIQELTKNEAIIQANEEARANAEMYRELYEDERQNAETIRKSNENTRINNENVRQSNESNRQQYESQRRVEEDERLTDEQVRVNAENIRIANENERLRKEIERQNAEELRQIAYNSSLYVRMDEAESQLAHKPNKKDLYLNVKDFGAKGDGVTDDREAIQNALDYIAERGGGCLYFPHPDNYYRIGSTVVEDGKNVGLVIKSHGVRMMGEHMSVKIQARAWMDTLMYFPSRADRFTLEDITISGNYVVDYCMRTNEYCPYMKLDNVRFEQANNTAVYVYTYVTVLNKCIFASSPLGVHLSGTSNSIATSTTFISCYAVSCTVGYKTTHATYCSFVSCACDHADIGYDITGRGIGMTGCGCESSRQPLKFSSFRGISINGFYIYNCGGEDEDNKVNYLVEFVTGAHATISGLMVESCKNYNYKLGLTDDNYGYENITITDDCITKSECYSVTNWKFASNPIKLLRNETTKAVTITCTLDQLRAEFDKLPDVINHDVTITISGGTTSNYIVLQNKTGRGRIILDLNGYDIAPTAGSVHAIRIFNMHVNMLIHNGTLSQTAVHNYAEIASVYNSGNIAFKNVAFKNITGNKGGSAVCCMRNAVVSVHNCTYSGWFGADNVYKVYHNDGSCITQGEITPQS